MSEIREKNEWPYYWITMPLWILLFLILMIGICNSLLTHLGGVI